MMNKIGIIGLGHMGQAMINGFKKNNLDKSIIGYHFDLKTGQSLAKKLQIKVVADYQKFLQEAEIIIIAVRPNQFDPVIEELKRFDLKSKIVISIISGLSIAKIQEKIHQDVKIVRALPNLNANVGLSVTGVAFNKEINNSQKSLIINYLNNFGKTYEIAEEYFSTFTVLAGCTPAYFFKLIDAIYQSGIKHGLNKDLALNIALESGYGSLTTVLNSELTPRQLVDAVCVPNGITIEGIKYLNDKDFDKIIEEAIVKSIKKDLKGH